MKLMDKRLDGKVIVITGASSGFGKGAALKFASLGAHVVIGARRVDLLENIALECESAGGKAIAVKVDVSKNEDVVRLRETAINSFGRIDVWINNAGAAAIGKFTETPLADHVKVVETDLLGTIYGAYAVLPDFIGQGFGTLINVGSMISRIPAPYYPAYSAAKHGVLGLSGALRQELDAQELKNVHVCTVLPMAMETPFFEHAANYTGKKAVPLPPVSQPEMVIDVFLDLIFNPKAEVAVGAGAVVFSVFDSLTPGVSEKLMGVNTHKTQMEDAPDMPATAGNLNEPTDQGTGVHGSK